MDRPTQCPGQAIVRFRFARPTTARSGPRPKTLEGVAALTRDQAPAIVERLRGVRFEFGAETAAIVRSRQREPLIVEKQWVGSPGLSSREEPRYVVTRGPNVNIDSDVCGLRVSRTSSCRAPPDGLRRSPCGRHSRS